MSIQTLLTGFGPFGNVIKNPTERLVRHFAEAEVPGHDLTTCVLPTSFQRAPQIMSALLRKGGRDGQPFDNVLMLGVATGSPHWRVERWGRNHSDGKADADGFTPNAGQIVAGGPEVLPVTVPVEALLAALEQEGLPVTPSDSAGGYLCNHILYVTLHGLQCAEPSAQAGFLHVPADEQTLAPDAKPAPVFAFVQQVVAVETTLAVLAERRRR